jgi:hypothetical protein
MKQVARRASFFVPEDGGNILLRKVDCIAMDYKALYPRR